MKPEIEVTADQPRRGRPSNEQKLTAARPLMEFTLRDSALHVYSPSDLKGLVSGNLRAWKLPETMSIARILSFMEEVQIVRKTSLQFPSRSLTRYLTGNPSIYEIALSVKAQGFFSHYTAMQHHGLTEQIPKTIYVNEEQPPQRDALPDISQDGIDAAFKRPPRASNAIAEFDGWRICQLSTMGTDRLGVVSAHGPNGENIAVTDIERTLLDCVVRPVYAGGVNEVLKAFSLARERVSINRLSSLLKQMAYRYPYHQVIGFYLERAGGYRPSSIDLFRRIPREFDFYLTHNIKPTEYISDWRLIIPKDF